MNSHWQQRSTATQRLNVCSITCSERYELNRIIKTQMRWLVAAWLCVYLSAQALLVWPSEGGGGECLMTLKSKWDTLCLPHTHTHTLTVSITCNRVWDKFMSWASDTCWWLKMSYTEWVIRCLWAGGPINPGLGRVTLSSPDCSCLLTAIFPPCVWCSAAPGGQSTAGRQAGLSSLWSTQGSIPISGGRSRG